MKLYYDITQAIQVYLITRDDAHLHHAIDTIKSEIDEPQLQESILTLDKMSGRAVEMIVAREGYLRIATDEVTNTDGVPVDLDKYIRVMDAASDGTTSIVLKVAAIEDKYLLLVPYAPGAVEGTDGAEH